MSTATLDTLVHHGVCYVDGWRGPERPTRDAAHDDAVRHIWAVPGGHHVNVEASSRTEGGDL